MKKRSKKIIHSEHIFQGKKGALSYLLKRSSARRTIAICVDEKAGLSVASPFRAKQKDISSFLGEKENWIYKKIDEAQRNQLRLGQRDYRSGSEFLFLGKKCDLEVVPQNRKRPMVEFLDSKWRVLISSSLSDSEQKKTVKKKLVQWYQCQAKEILGCRLFHYSRLLDIEPLKIAVRTQKRVWGNCDFKTKTIHLNWMIILSPLEVIDYVIVHELCHLFEPNHSSRFWAKVEKYMPDYKNRKKWLNDHTCELMLP